MVDSVTGKPFLTHQAHFANDRMAGSVPKWNHGTHISEGTSTDLRAQLAGNDSDATSPAPRLSFGELLDVINPLHHLPVVGSVYRHLTGDDISATARITGGAIYGGPVGAVTSIVTAAIEEHGGGDVTTSIIDAGTSERVYSFEEDPRTAGLKQYKNGEDDKPIAEDAVEIAQIVTEKPETKSDYNESENLETDLFKIMPEATPITKIEMADVVVRPSQHWKFNA